MNRTSETGIRPRSIRLQKAGLFVGLGALVSVPYFLLQYHPLFPAVVVPVTAIDRIVPLVQPAAWIYLTLYALLALPMFLSRDVAELRTMAFGFGWIAV